MLCGFNRSNVKVKKWKAAEVKQINLSIILGNLFKYFGTTSILMFLNLLWFQEKTLRQPDSNGLLYSSQPSPDSHWREMQDIRWSGKNSASHTINPTLSKHTGSEVVKSWFGQGFHSVVTMTFMSSMEEFCLMWDIGMRFFIHMSIRLSVLFVTISFEWW